MEGGARLRVAVEEEEFYRRGHGGEVGRRRGRGRGGRLRRGCGSYRSGAVDRRGGVPRAVFIRRNVAIG